MKSLCERCRKAGNGLMCCECEADRAFVKTENDELVHYHAAVLQGVEDLKVAECEDYEEKEA